MGFLEKMGLIEKIPETPEYSTEDTLEMMFMEKKTFPQSIARAVPQIHWLKMYMFRMNFMTRHIQFSRLKNW